MVIRVTEKTIEDIEKRLSTLDTSFNKIIYLESALKSNFGIEAKRFIWQKISELYEERKMFEKAAKAMMGKAGFDITYSDKIDSYLRAGELYAKAGKVEDAEQMFVRALRDANDSQKNKIKLTMKNIFLVNAQELEKNRKSASSCKFYERLIKMNLDQKEKEQIKQKLITIYKSLGKFKEIELLEGIN